ncbi:hypothetical protein DFH28DRAFT_1121923 [Melampsora americana]|nr:hypothetical protein DFH28DRAFT_1121923 [Melampsora americana]
MALPGEEIRPPKSKRQKKSNNGPPGSARQRLANLNNREAQASMDVLSDNNPAPNNAVGASNVHPINEEGENDDDNEDVEVVERYDELQPMGTDNLVDQENLNPLRMNRLEYFRSVTYQERTLRKEAHWQAVIHTLFNEFLPCSRMTFQWGHPTLWNHDWNSPCKCRDWQKHDVIIDTIDLIGRSKLLIKSCDCTTDLIRLINMGYIGSTPIRPRTAFSLRLLRFHHILWKFTSVRLAPFVESLDEYLDAQNSIFFVKGKDQRRDLRTCFSEAVDVYREMMRLEEEMATRALKLTALDELADNCPSCFGPKVPGLRDGEPDLIICLDANFQQRRHLAASAAWRGDTGILPSLFIPPADVKLWKDRLESTQDRRRAATEVIDPCSAQHTTANDTRGRQTWRGCDETGLMGMACRHDHLLKFINLVQTGERGYYPLAMMDWILRKTVKHDHDSPQFGILYDIGCNMEKSILKRNLFREERTAGRLKFGTSVFHSHVHQWACQLKYNPRLNENWGLPDGEGLERIWSSLAALVGALRYSTKPHRLCALNLRAQHTNRVKRMQSSVSKLISNMAEQFNNSSLLNVVQWLKQRLASSGKLFRTSAEQLQALRRRNPTCTEAYLTAQWNQQRQSQLQVMVDENSQALTLKLNQLAGLEERHQQTEEELRVLQAKRRQNRTASDRRKLVILPETMELLEEEIDVLVEQLGGDHYRDMPGRSSKCFIMYDTSYMRL